MKKADLKNSVFCKGVLQWKISIRVACIQNEILQQLLPYSQRSFILLWTRVQQHSQVSHVSNKNKIVLRLGGLKMSLDQSSDQVV